MTETFSKPLTFWQTVKETIIFYVQVFKPILGLVILASAAQAVVSLVMPLNPTVGLALSILSSVVHIFFYAWILSHADSVLTKGTADIKESLHVAKSRFLQLVTLLVLYIGLGFVLFVFGFGMSMLGSAVGARFIFAILTLAFALFVFTFIAFAMPSVILEGEPAIKSFEYSVRLVWGHWWHSFGLFIIFVIPVILLSLGIMLLPTRNIVALTVYEFFLHVVTYPLMVALVLVLYHDLKTRKQISGFKHLDDVNKVEHRNI